MSFDIRSLFTNILIHETINIICRTVCSHREFPYTYKSLHTLLSLFNESIFLFNKKVFKQVDGISMGNPLAPILAEFFMGHFEKEIFDTDHKREFYPTNYFRYVDDILCFFREEEHIDAFLMCLNRVHNNIKFTVEKSINNSIPFLDIKLHMDNGVISTEVYRKDTFTGRLLNFKSVVPKTWKDGLINTLVHRAYHLSSTWHNFHKEIETIRNVLIFNDYPNWSLNRVLKRFLNSLYADNNNDNLTTKKEEGNYWVIKIPYCGTPSIVLRRKINHILRRLHNKRVKICFTRTRLRTFFAIKDATASCLRSSVIYKFCCSGDPNIAYVGETGRQLARRINDHINTNTAVTQHLQRCQMCDSNFSTILQNFTILDTANDDIHRNIKEALYIKQLKPSLNTQCTSGKRGYVLNLF